MGILGLLGIGLAPRLTGLFDEIFGGYLSDKIKDKAQRKRIKKLLHNGAKEASENLLISPEFSEIDQPILIQVVESIQNLFETECQ